MTDPESAPGQQYLSELEASHLSSTALCLQSGSDSKSDSTPTVSVAKM